MGDLKKKLDAQNREEMKMLAKKHKDKAELNRIKREAQQKHIQMAVQERQKVHFYGIHVTILICQKSMYPSVGKWLPSRQLIRDKEVVTIKHVKCLMLVSRTK